MSSQMELNTRPLYVAGTAFLLDKFVMGETNTMSSLYFAGAVGAGVYTGELLSKHIPKLPSINNDLYNGKTLGERMTEIGTGGLLAYSLNRYVLNNDPTFGQANKRLGVIIASDVIGTYATEYMAGTPLEFLE